MRGAGVAQLVERQQSQIGETHNLESIGPRSRGFDTPSRHQFYKCVSHPTKSEDTTVVCGAQLP
jgi:hypothetical protein